MDIVGIILCILNSRPRSNQRFNQTWLAENKRGIQWWKHELGPWVLFIFFLASHMLVQDFHCIHAINCHSTIGCVNILTDRSNIYMFLLFRLFSWFLITWRFYWVQGKYFLLFISSLYFPLQFVIIVSYRKSNRTYINSVWLSFWKCQHFLCLTS